MTPNGQNKAQMINPAAADPGRELTAAIFHLLCHYRPGGVGEVLVQEIGPERYTVDLRLDGHYASQQSAEQAADTWRQLIDNIQMLDHRAQQLRRAEQ